MSHQSLCPLNRPAGLRYSRRFADLTAPSARKAEAAKVAYQDRQSRNMRFADEYAGRLIATANQARPTLVDAQQRELMSGWMLSQVNAAYVAATGDNPTIATLDLLTLKTLSRMVPERQLRDLHTRKPPVAVIVSPASPANARPAAGE